MHVTQIIKETKQYGAVIYQFTAMTIHIGIFYHNNVNTLITSRNESQFNYGKRKHIIK